VESRGRVDRSSAVPTRNGDEDVDVVSCSGGFEGAPTETPSSSSLSLPSFSPFSGSVKWLATKWRRGDGVNARATEGRGFYSRSSKLPWRMTERLVMCRAHRTALVRGGSCVGAALRWGTGSCDVREPGPASAALVGARSRDEAGVGKKMIL